jgi:hypothetical protein
MATKKQRQQEFIETRTQELTAAGKPVDQTALAARFENLASSPAGRKQITTVVQRGRLVEVPEKTPAAGANQSTSTVSPSTEDILTITDRIANLTFQFQQQQSELQLQQQRTDARQVIQATLAQYGLQDLSQYLYDLVAGGEINLNNSDAIVQKIKDQPAYIQRFPANQARLKKGLPEFDPATYIGLERQYQATLRANGLPERFYDDPKEDFAKWIEGDVSPAELQMRIEQGYNAVNGADPMVVSEMRRLYKIGNGDLAAYFLDPERAQPLLTGKQLQRQAQAANISARAQEQAGITLDAEFAEELASRGISAQQALSGFGEIGALGELTQTFAGETEIATRDFIGAAFGYSPEAAREIETRRRRRIAEFSGGGGFTRTSGETSGTIRTSIGEAQ